MEPSLENIRNNGLVLADPDRLGGTPCFTGTRVPIRLLFDNLAVGLTIDEIVDSYQSLTREIVLAALEEAARLLEICEDRPAQEK